MLDDVFVCSLFLSSTAVIFAVVHGIGFIPSTNLPNLDCLSLAQKHTLDS